MRIRRTWLAPFAVGAVGLTLLALLASRISGMVRDAVIAYQFGAGATTDSFVSAFTLPDIISSVLLTGLVGVAVIPVLIGSVSGGASVWRTANGILNLLIVGSVAITIVGILAADFLIRTLTPGLSQAQAASAAMMARIMFPTIALFVAAGLFSGILNIGNRFVIPALTGLVVNAVMIAAAFIFGTRLGIVALAWGFLAGSILQVVVLLPLATRLGYRYHLTFGLHDPGVRAAFTAMGPFLAVLVMGYGRLIVERWLGSILVPGTIALLNFSNRVYAFAPAMIVAPISTVFYPLVVRGVMSKDAFRTRETVSTGVRLIILGAVPAMLLLRYFSHPIVSAIYQRGQFDAKSAAATGYLVGLFALGLVPVCLNDFLTRTLFASQRAAFAVVTAASSLAITVVADAVLIRLIGYPGLAWGATAGAWCLLVILAVDAGIWRQRDVLLTTIRAAIAGAVMTAASVGVFDSFPAGHAVVRVGIALVVGVVVYVAGLRILSSNDARLLTSLAHDYVVRSRT